MLWQAVAGIILLAIIIRFAKVWAISWISPALSPLTTSQYVLAIGLGSFCGLILRPWYFAALPLGLLAAILGLWNFRLRRHRCGRRLVRIENSQDHTTSFRASVWP